MPFHRPGRAGTIPLKSKKSIIYPQRHQTGHGDFLLDQTHQQHQAHVQGEVDQRGQGEGFKQVGGELGCLFGLRQQFHQADQGRHGGVLEHVEEFGGERRNDDAVSLGQQHVPVDLRQAETHGTGGRLLAARQGFNTGTHLFAHPCGGKQTQTHHYAQVGRGRWAEVLLVPVLQVLRQQIGYQEVPHEQLNQQGYISENFHVNRGDTRDKTVRQGAHHAQQRTQYQRNNPGDNSDRDGPAQSGNKPVEIRLAAYAGGLEEYAPVPVVIHSGSPLRWVYRQALASGNPFSPTVQSGTRVPLDNQRFECLLINKKLIQQENKACECAYAHSHA